MIISLNRGAGHVVAFVTALDFRPWRATCKRPNRRLLRGGLPFSARQAQWTRGFGFCCSRAFRRANVDCQRDALPRLSPGTRALCSSDFPLVHQVAQRSSFPSCGEAIALSTCVDQVAQSALGPGPVPKGRFELPRDYSHYALNVARLPIPPLRLICCVPHGADRRTRTDDLLFTKQLLYQLS